MKKKFFSLLLALGMLTGILSGCGSTSSAGSPSKSASGGELAQIQKKGEIVFATEGTWSPWTYHDKNDKLVGFDIEIARAVAKKLGVKATFAEGKWDGLLAGLEAGRYDSMANGVEVTAERKEKYDFSDPYGYIRTAVIVKDGSAISSFEDLKGKTTANTLSSTYAELAERYGAKTTGVDDLNQTIELLLAGRVDATLNAEVTYYDYMNQHPDAKLKIAALTDDASHVAFPLRKGDVSASLRRAMNEAVAELRKDGTLKKISVKYFGSDITAKS